MPQTDLPISDLFAFIESDSQHLTLRFGACLDVGVTARIFRELFPVIRGKRPAALTVDLQEVTRIDDYGALVLFELKHLMTGRSFEIRNTGARAHEVLSQVDFDFHEKRVTSGRRRFRNPIVRLGEATISQFKNTAVMVSFLGSAILAMAKICLRPKSLRIGDTITCMEKTGVDALPIVALISFLLGLIMAFMSSMQLKQFGANIYVASLVGLAMVSELGPIMTAIIVAGRTGSSVAAEIGTMKISEEIDALYTMGFDPTLFLAVPRIVAAVLVVPLLALFSDIFAIAGGLLVGVTMLNLTASAYIAKTIQTLTLFEVLWGMFKSGVFALVISWIGCLRGFQARGGAEAVGNAATSAVVSSLFLIILLDSIFAVIRSYW